MLEVRLKAAAYLNRGVSIYLGFVGRERRAQVKFTFFSKEGLPDYIRDIDREAQPLFRQIASIIKLKEKFQVEVALQPNKGYKHQFMSFANAVRTRDGGVHETGFKAALTKVVNDYALKLGVIKNREKDGFQAGRLSSKGLNFGGLDQAAQPAISGPDQRPPE